jgi:hypothetical protein
MQEKCKKLFTVDGTLLEVWTNLESLKKKDGSDESLISKHLRMPG